MQGDDEQPRYASTIQVAKALGVSVTTVKRWVDDGILPAYRTVGGHRKLLMSDVIRLARKENLPQADFSELLPRPKQMDLSEPRVIRDQLIAAIERPDSELVRSLINGAYKQGCSIELLADEIIGPALRKIGRDWEDRKIEVFHEHRATQAVVSALFELESQLLPSSRRRRPVAVGAAPEGDHSILPSLLAKLVLVDAGWDAINLGPHTPMSAMQKAIVDLKPRLMWLSVSHIDKPEVFLGDYTSFYRAAEALGVAVAVGGSALTETIRCRMPYTTFGDGLSHLAALARMLHRDPTPPRRGRPPKSE